MGRLNGRIALVTGAAAGIGLAVAEVLAQEGAHVVITDLDGAGAAAAAERLSAGGRGATGFACDVTSGPAVKAMFERIAASHGRLDIVINNAGLNVRSDFRHLTDEAWLKIRETNLDGAVRVARDAFPLLAASGKTHPGRPAIVNLSSIMASRALRQLAAYSATKGAISALTRSLAVEYAAFGIRVNALAPGFIETALTDRFIRNPGVAKALLEKTPLRRFGTPADVAKAALFLAGDESAFITGEVLAVDGGMAAGL